MTKLAVLAFAFVLIASSAAAQTVERVIDLSSLGWGNIEARPVDTDGNPLTEEWLVNRFEGFGRVFRVVAVRGECADGLAIGDWFNPLPQDGYATSITVQRFGYVDKLVVTVWPSPFWRTARDVMHVVSINTPECGSGNHR